MALFVALIALWLASANLKKMEAGNRELKSQLTSDIAKSKREIEKHIEGISRKVGALDGKMKGLTEGQTQTREKITNIESDVAKVGSELRELIDSIPSQYRQARGNVNSGFG
ncbi:MAG: hypothetical protein O3A85_04620 [Proteobacteria bacterium]|nr:hypothetical protein [Pseudomonadota bacterium]